MRARAGKGVTWLTLMYALWIVLDPVKWVWVGCVVIDAFVDFRAVGGRLPGQGPGRRLNPVELGIDSSRPHCRPAEEKTMEVILLENIGNLGGLGDKVDVKPGYGRNFLIPQGKAVAGDAR